MAKRHGDSKSATKGNLTHLLAKLTGLCTPIPPKHPESMIFPAKGLGYSQLNELLLLHGYQRISQAVFQYLVDGTTMYRSGAAISTIRDLREGIDRFRTLAMLQHGSIANAYRRYAEFDESLFAEEVRAITPLDMRAHKRRHEVVLPVAPIRAEDTYLLGYIVEEQIKRRLVENPVDASALALQARRREVIDRAKRNQDAYLASDHMDVYVATSMRERHEYSTIARVTREIFSHPALAGLRLRYFDPTQAYCESRIDKGLAEALMLKRAKCTIYLVQETDTLGKDSELAATLAQGKTVIAYVPAYTVGTAQKFIDELNAGMGGEGDERERLLALLQVYSGPLAWNCKEPDRDARRVQEWVRSASSFDAKTARKLLAERIIKLYDSRANTLKTIHPLAIQVSLETGVATGVLVARSVAECARLVRRVLTNMLEFKIEEDGAPPDGYLLLKERITGCVFRVVTGEPMLTNAFWNFYTL